MKNEQEIQLGESEQDFVLILPDNRRVTIQYRYYEAISIDIILPEITNVYNWVGEEMKAAKAYRKNQPEVRMADQLCIPL